MKPSVLFFSFSSRIDDDRKRLWTIVSVSFLRVAGTLVLSRSGKGAATLPTTELDTDRDTREHRERKARIDYGSRGLRRTERSIRWVGVGAIWWVKEIQGCLSGQQCRRVTLRVEQLQRTQEEHREGDTRGRSK